jgi:hypothetical protein
LHRETSEPERSQAEDYIDEGLHRRDPREPLFYGSCEALGPSTAPGGWRLFKARLAVLPELGEWKIMALDFMPALSERLLFTLCHTPSNLSSVEGDAVSADHIDRGQAALDPRRSEVAWPLSSDIKI